MVAPAPPVRTTSQKRSRLPLHRFRPSPDKSSPALPASLLVSHTENSHASVINDANKRSDCLISGSRPTHKTTHVGLNLMSVQGQQRVADEVLPCKRLQSQLQPRRCDDMGVVGVRPAAATGRNHIVNGGVVNGLKYAVRLTDNPSCGVRMSALRSAGRHQQPSSQSPTSSIKSSSSMASDRHATAARLSNDVAVVGQPRRAAKLHEVSLSHHASTSSVDSTCSEHMQHHALVAPRRPVRPLSTVSSATDDSGDVTDRQHNRGSHDSSASQFCRKSVMRRAVFSSESGEIISSSSDWFGPPTSRHLPAANQQTDRSDSYLSTFGVGRPTDIVRSARHQQRSDAAIVEPQRRCYRLWRPSKTDVNDLSRADSMSTITSIDSSSLSSGTLTDDDESADESTTTVDRDNRRRDHADLDTSVVSSAGLASNHAQPPLYQASITSGHKTRTRLPSRCTSHVSSALSEVSSPPSAMSMVVSRWPAKNYSKYIQRICNFGVTTDAPVTVNKHTTSPPAQPEKFASPRIAANRPRNRPNPASASEELPTSSRSVTTSSPLRLSSESTTAVVKNAARRVAHSSSVEAAVGRRQQATFADSSSVQMNLSPSLDSTAIKPSNSPPHSRVQTRQTANVKKAASTAAVSNHNSSVSHIPVCSSSKVACQSSLQCTSSAANTRAASKISSALTNHTRRTGSSTYLHTNVVDKDSRNDTNDRELVDRSVGNTASVMAPARVTVKPFTAAARSSHRETVNVMDNNHPMKTARDMPTPSTRSTKTQTSSVVIAHSVDSGRSNDSTAVTKRPPPPPSNSKLKRPGFIPASDRRRVTVAEQRRPLSVDCSTVSSLSQRQPVNVCCKKSDSCTNVASLSTSTDQATTTSKPTEGVLNKNAQLAKSYDCITSLTNNSERQNSGVICSKVHGSSTSLVDVPPRKLVKPYSVINRCSTFGQRMTALKEVHSTTTGCNREIETKNMVASSRSSLASQTRASELPDLPEVDEFECDCQMSTIDRLSTNDENRSSDGRWQQSRTATVESPPISPSIQQKPIETHKYRAEYSTFVSAVPPKDNDNSIVEAFQGTISTINNSSSHRDHVSITTKQDKNDKENSCSFKTRLPENCNRQAPHKVECFRLTTGSVEAAVPVMLSAEISIVEDSTATSEAADKPSSLENYTVTYESDNIVVLDREPVIDCLTPDDDVVSTEVGQLLAVPVDSVGTASGEGGLLRTLPLSESGYDTWKSSQGSVTVASACVESTCTVAPDFSGQQYQKVHEKDGTLRSCVCEHLKALDTQSAQVIFEKNVYTVGCDTCPEGGDSLALFRDRDNPYSETTNTAAGVVATVELKDNDRRSESPSHDDDSGRVADGNVEDSARRDAQMFASICSDATEPVVGGPAFPVVNSAISQGSGPSLSPPDNAVCGLEDPSDICFPSQTIPSSDSDILPVVGASSHNTAHLECFDEYVHNASSLLPAMGHFRYHSDVERSGASDNTANVIHDDRPAVTCISTRKMTGDVDDGGDCVADMRQLDEHHEVYSKVCQQLKLSDSSRPQPSSTAVTVAVSDSASLDPYETICDDLLESVEANTSDSEKSHPSSSMCQAAAPRCTNIDHQPDNKSSEHSSELTPANDHDTTLTKAVSVSSSGVDWQSTYNSRSTLNSCTSPPSSMAVPGRLPVMTLRRARTNFLVVYQQTTSQPTVSQSRQLSAHGGHVEASTHETQSHKVDQEPETVDCRRALSVLASGLDDHGRRRLMETNVKGRAMSKPSFQSAAVDHDRDIAATSAVSLSSKIRPVCSSSTLTRYDDAAAPQNDVRCHFDLQGNQSPPTVHDLTTVKSKLPIKVTSSTHSSKKPSTFRKFLTSKLTNAVRRTQTKCD